MLSLLLLALTPCEAQQFAQVAGGIGIVNSYGSGAYGGGVSFYDFNGDGWDDITLASQQGDSIHFFQNIGGTFQRLPSLVPNTSEVKQVLWVDYDNDGDKDLYLTSNLGTNRLYENTGDLNLVDKTSAVGFPLDSMPSFGAAWGDYDNDGFLDLYLTNRTGSVPFSNYLYRNLGNGTFADATLTAGVPDSNKRAFCASFVDYDNDRWPDIYVAQDYQFGNTMFRNLGTGVFADASVSSGSNLTMDAMCVTAGDYDNDNDLDIYITNTSSGNKMLRNDNNGTFTEVAAPIGVALNQTSWGSTFLDMDNDGDLDLFVCSEAPGSAYVSTHHIYENLGNGTFSYLNNAGFGTDAPANFSSAYGDFNRDGYPDIAVINNFNQDLIRVWENQGSGSNWIEVRLRGTSVNRDGIGAFIEVYCGPNRYMRYTQCGSGFLAQNSGNVHVGLSNAPLIDSIRVLWPDGSNDVFEQVCVNRLVTLIQGSSGPVSPPTISGLGTLSACGDTVTLSVGNHFGYAWSSGDTSASITVLNGGNFQVTVSDTNGLCQISPAFTLPTLSSLSVTANVTQALTCGGATNGVIASSASGGIAPYTYTWSDGNLGSTNSSLGSGMYEVTLTDAAGCQDRDLIFLSEPSALIGNELIQNVSCNGLSDAQITAFGYGGFAPYSYAWANPSVASNSLNAIAAGNYLLTITDSLGCAYIDTVIIVQPDPLQSGLVTTDLSCFGFQDGSVASTPTGGTAPYTYQWSTGSSNSSQVDSLLPGNYLLTLSDAQNCQRTDSAVVVSPTAIVASVSTQNSSCFGKNNGSALVTGPSGGTGALSIQWVNGPVGASYAGLGAGSYPVVVTDQNGCQFSDTATITQPPLLTMSIVGNPVSCAGENDGLVEVNVTGGTPGYSYTWNSGPDTNLLVGLSGGTYSVTVTDQNGCIGFQSFFVFEPAPVGANSSVDHVLCFGESNGNIDLTVFGGIAPHQVSWNGGGFIGAQLSGLPAGSYTYLITDSLGCSNQATIAVLEPPLLGVTGSNKPQTFGANGQAIAFAVGGTPPYSYQWNDPQNQTTDTATNLLAGDYIVTVTDANGCENTYALQVPFVTGISDNTLPALQWQLYPNPAREQVVVEWITNPSEGYALVVVNAVGKVVRTWNMSTASTQASFDLAGLASGLYVCQLRQDGTPIDQRMLMVQH